MEKQNLQKLYDEIQVNKAERKMIKASIKDHYDNSPEWKKIKEELDEIKAKKKAYDQSVREAYAKDFERVMDLSDVIRADEELLSDLCFRELMQNNKVEIKDEKGNDYEPVIKVVFKKM
jgi:hypothetical protein